MAQIDVETNNSSQHPTDHYTKNYCEENIYWLAQSFSEKSNLDNTFVVFISNQSQQVPIWSQRSSIRPDKLAIWDYHVILLAFPGSTTTAEKTTSLIFDLDSNLPSPSPLPSFIQHALVINSSELPETHRRLFRVVPAASYLENFSSDRSHMLVKTTKGKNNAGGGGGGGGGGRTNHEYMSPPPSYPCIVASNGDANTFPKYLRMPSYNHAVVHWKESPLIKYRVSDGAGDGSVPASPYGLVLTEDAFLEFAKSTTHNTFFF